MDKVPADPIIYHMKKHIFVLAFLLGTALFANGQNPPAAGQTKTISGGVLNGKATSLPKPVPPPGDASGAVSVQVLIDEGGHVASAAAISGPPSLRPSAEQAALAARFSQTTLAGQPVKVSGVITYNFMPAPSYVERLETAKLAAFLYMVRGSVRDLSAINKAMETTDFVKSSLGEFPKQQKALAPLSSLGSQPVDKRLGIVDGAIAAVLSDLGPAETWEFELGKNLGDCFSQLFSAIAGSDMELAAIDETALRLSIAKIKGLANEPPLNFPPDVLQRVKEIGEMSERKPLATGDNLLQLLSRIESFIDTIAPETDK